VKYYSAKVDSCGRDQKSLTQVTKHLVGETKETVLPAHSSDQVLAQSFSDFFEYKVVDTRSDIDANTLTAEGNYVQYEPRVSG